MTSEDFSRFASFGISPDLLSEAGVRRVTDSEARDAYGIRFSAGADLCGLIFPYFDPRTGRRVTARLRRDKPEVDCDGKPLNKYLSPYADQRHLYFAPRAKEVLDNSAVPVIVVEAEKSALALTALGRRMNHPLLAIACGGCWGWCGRVGKVISIDGSTSDEKGPLPDLDLICWENRDVIICFDSNAATNAKVRQARHELATELSARGGRIRVAELPSGGGVNGPDDLIASAGDEALLRLLDSARPFAETAIADAERAISDLEESKAKTLAPVLVAVAAVDDQLQRTLLIGRLAGLKIPGLTKAVIQDAVKAKRKAAEEKQANASKMAQRARQLRLNVSPGQLIAELEAYYSRRRHLPQDTALVEALFCMNTYVFDAFDTTAYLLYESATGGCGKTTALEFHEAVCARAYLGVDPSAAVLYRRIERDKPTWLLDEARILQSHGERAQELLALFDAGYKAGATVSRCEEHGETLRDFSVYCPKVLARIGGFKGTLLDRGIVIHLEKARGLPQTRRKVLKKEAAPLKEALDAYALQYRAALENLYENEPDETYWPQLSGRESEIWGPLLTHARLAGPQVEMRALTVALEFSTGKAEIAVVEDHHLALAQEALEVLNMLEGEKFLSRELMEGLAGREAWGEHLAGLKSEKAKESAVGRFFRAFRLQSRKHTASGTGYSRLEAIEALCRHLPIADALPGSVTVSASHVTRTNPDGCGSDTSGKEVSSYQLSETKGAAIAVDTLTLQALGIEEDL
ncbi:MAG: DUF3854 domain-containing protein [Candidatus Korobacteraceae bacterium]